MLVELMLTLESVVPPLQCSNAIVVRLEGHEVAIVNLCDLCERRFLQQAPWESFMCITDRGRTNMKIICVGLFAIRDKQDAAGIASDINRRPARPNARVVIGGAGFGELHIRQLT